MNIDDRQKGMLQYVSEGATDADLEAAGYTPEEISLIPKKEVVPFTPKEADNLEAYTPTVREGLRSNLTKGGKALGLDAGTAEHIASGIAGTRDQMGLLDFTPVGAVESTQEGYNRAKAGYTTGDKTDMALGALDVGLGVVSAIPGGKVLAKGMGKVVDKVIDAYDPTVLRSIGTPVKAEPYKPTLFATTQDGKLALNPESLAEFYSPTVATIKAADFPSKGYKGSELVKLLQNKSPGVRKAELDAMDLGIDPMKRYSKEEAVSLAEQKSYKVSTKEFDDTLYKDQQRQPVKDKEVSYATLVVDATPTSAESAVFYPSQGRTHYNDNTIAHTRVSVRENPEGKQYLLVEEIQSDLVQHGALKPRPAVSRDSAYEELLSSQPMQDYEKKLFEADKQGFTDFYKLAAEDTRIYDAKSRGLDVAEDEAARDALTERLKKTFNLPSIAEKAGVPIRDANIFSFTLQSRGRNASYMVDKRMQAVGKPPLTEDTDAVRLALQSAMAKADKEGVSTVVIPNIQRIITSGRARVGSKDYEKFMSPSSGFTKTYKKGVDKFVSQLKEEFGDAVQVKNIDLPYRSDKAYADGVEHTLDNSALQIDFSGIKDTNLRVGRFAEGGMVEDKQMNRLMADGGMADDGMTHEPVTGNEVPPGSLAKEVRDDIPTQLSEGEYVIPADVVRFFGVKYFEDLRSQAKQGLSDMEANGRIGGAPVDSNGVPAEDDTLTPEEEQMLQEALGQTGMAIGGDVTTPWNRKDFQYNPSPTGEQISNSSVDTRKYINPTTGEVKTYNFSADGTALGAIDPNFVPWTQELEDSAKANTAPATAPAVLQAPEVSGGGSDRNDPGTTGGTTSGANGGTSASDSWAEKNFGAITSDPYKFGVEALDDTRGKYAGKGLALTGALTGNPVLTLAGGAVGTGSKVQNIAEAKTALQVMESQGLSGTKEYTDLQGKIKNATDALPGLAQLAVEKEFAATGKKYVSSLDELAKAKVGATGVTTPGATTTTIGVTTPPPKPVAPPVATPAVVAPKVETVTNRGVTSTQTTAGTVDNSGSKNGDLFSSRVTTGSTAPTSSPRPAAKPAAPQSTSAANKQAASAASAAKSTSSGSQNRARTGLVKGGLITKPTKTTAKTKGLGGKQ
jgi:hypothetical protein